MQEPDPFVALLLEWIEVFMRRTMGNFLVKAKESGLSMSQMMTLLRIRHKGARGVTDIGEELGISSAAASQMLDGLVQQGLIRRSEDPDDRRVKQIVLTEKGILKVHGGFKERQKWMEDLAATLTPAEKEQIKAALNLLIEKANRLDGQPQG
jgi:DNA-binding MarR family transcriptional regulator